MILRLPFQHLDVFEKRAENPKSEQGDDDEKQIHADLVHHFGRAKPRFGQVAHGNQFLGQGEEPVHETGHDRQGEESANGDARYDLGHQRADLDAQKRAQQHAHGQRVEDEAVDGVLRYGAIPGREDDLENIRTHGGQGRNSQHIDEDGEGQEAAA